MHSKCSLFDVLLNDSHESINQIDTSKLLFYHRFTTIEYSGLSYEPAEIDLALCVARMCARVCVCVCVNE